MKKSLNRKYSLFLITLISIFLSLILCELFLKYTHYQKKHASLDFTEISDINTRFKINSDYIYTFIGNFEYRHPLKPKDPNKTNIAFVGDSVTWSFGSDDNSTYPLSFEKIYNQSHQKKALVNNFGTPGYNFDQEYLLIKEKVLPEYQPDIIVWNLNVNDMWESNISCLFTQKNNQWYQLSARKNLYYWYEIISASFPKNIVDSRLFNLFRYHLTNIITHQSIAGDNYTFGCTSTDFSTPTQHQILNKLNYFISSLQSELQKGNIKLIITLVPYQGYLDEKNIVNQITPLYSDLVKNLESNHLPHFINYNENIPKSINLNPADEYFLDSSADSAAKGWRHPNQKAYTFMAQKLNNYFTSQKVD